MIDRGLKNEVQSLLDQGYDSQLKPFQSIGYKQMVSHLEGKLDLDQTIHEIQRETRHYAKRQITWFKKMTGAQSVPVQENDSPQSLKDKIVAFLSQGVVLILIALFGILVPKPAVAGEAEPYPSALRLIQKGEWDAARSTLEGLKRSKLNSKQSHRVDFLLARAWIQNNQHQQAADLLQSLMKSYETMEDYILLELARSQTALGQYPEALQSLQTLNALKPPSLLAPAAGLLMADVHSLMNQPKEALTALQFTEQLILKRFPQPKYREQIPEILHRQIQIQETLRDFKGSYESYRRLYTHYPEHEHALDALTQMQRLEEKEGVFAQPLTEREKKRRVRRLLAKTRFERVIEEIEAMRKQHQPLPANYYFYLADAYKGLRKRPAANRVLTEFLNKHANHKNEAKARFTIARNLWNLGNPQGAAEGFQKAIRMSRKPRLAAEAQYLLGAVYEDLQQEKDAFREYEDLFRKSPDAEFAEKGAWRIGWAHYRAQRWLQAKEWFEKSIQRFPNGNLIEKNRFWLAKTLEQLGQPDEALKAFQNVFSIFPFTYHGLQAGKRLDEDSRNALLKEMSEGKVLKTEFVQTMEPPKNPGRPLTHQEHYHFKRGIELMGMGMYPEAQEELLRLNGSIRKTYTGVLWLSTWLNRAHAYADSLQLMHLFRRYKTKAGEKELPSAFWKNFYPPAYFVHVRAWSNRHQVDPWFATSLMRQESLYNTWALSPAGARGLMQLMPKTARKMVRQNGDTGTFEPHILFDPETNIQLGIQYLSGLVRKYKGNRAHILIAYNAGPKVLKAWKRRFKSIDDPDVFVESLPYPETRNYVKRVIRNHEIYKILYGAEGNSPTQDKTF